jgi:hypothetical protein
MKSGRVIQIIQLGQYIFFSHIGRLWWFSGFITFTIEMKLFHSFIFFRFLSIWFHQIIRCFSIFNLFHRVICPYTPFLSVNVLKSSPALPHDLPHLQNGRQMTLEKFHVDCFVCFGQYSTMLKLLGRPHGFLDFF